MSHPDQHTIDLLLEKHTLGICTPEERAMLERWYASFPGQGQVFDDEAEKEAIKASLKTNIFSVIQEEIATLPVAADRVPAKTSVRPMYWRAAAAILVLITAGSLFYMFSNKTKAVSYTAVSAPAGRKVLHMQLPDGSDMWLAPGSSLRYANSFAKGSRDIQIIDGLAYFTVKSAASHPFTVSTASGLAVKVLGTEFSVKAYKGVSDIQVSVGSGRVQVSDSSHVLGVLEAGQQIVYQLTTKTAIREEGQLEDWRAGSLQLNHVSFAEVARILQDLYQVPVSYDAALMSSYRFNIRIAKDASLNDVLETLKDLSGMTYTLQDGRVSITGVQQ